MTQNRPDLDYTDHYLWDRKGYIMNANQKTAVWANALTLVILPLALNTLQNMLYNISHRKGNKMLLLLCFIWKFPDSNNIH